MRVSSKERVLGRTVVDASGRAIGVVEALNVEVDRWFVEALVVKLHADIADEIGVRRTLLHAGTIEVPTGDVQAVGDAIVLRVPLAALRERAFQTGQPGASPAPRP